MRTATVLALSLIVQALCWVVVLGLRATMNTTVPQYLFGIQISHDLSMAITLLVLAAIPVSAIAAVVALVRVARQRFGRAAAR